MRRLTRYTSLLFFTLALLAAGFHSVVTHSPAYAVTVVGTKAADELSRADRVEVFQEVWETILEKYYNASFNGVDWSAVGRQYRPLIEQAASDAEFYEVLKRMVGELRDAHTRFHTPEQRRERERLQAVSAGVSIFDVEGKPVIVNVEANSDASRAGVEAGMIVIAIDGKPVSERLAEARARVAGTSTDRAVRLRVYRMIIDGDPGSILRLSLERADGSKLEVSLSRRIVSDTAMVTSRRLASGYGYVRLTLWKSPIRRDFKKALEHLRDVPGLVVD